MAKIVTLRDDAGDDLYPVTKIDSVDGGIKAVDVTEVEESALISGDMIQDGAITKNKVASNAISSTNIDWSSTPMSYSLVEVNTGATWIDGKAIYKRTYNCGKLLNNSTLYVNHGITNLGVIMKSESFTVYEGSVSTGVNLPIPYTAPTGIQNTVTVNFTSTQICLTTGTDRTAATAYVTIWYTKN